MGLRLVQDWLDRSRSRRQYFDEDLEQELLDLLEVSALLEIKEFALFELAYKEWYGRAPLSRVIEAHFSNYMFHGIIPAWVTSYTRQVLELQKREEELRVELESALSEYRSSIEVYRANQEALKVADDSYRVTLSSFKSGIVTQTQLNDAELLLTSSQLKTVQSLLS